MKSCNYQRGDTVLVCFSPVVGSEQADIRPAVIVSNSLFHRLNIVTVVALTSKQLPFPGRVSIEPSSKNGLKQASDALTFQIRTISTRPERIIKKLGRLSNEDMNAVDDALKISLKLS